MIKKINMSVEKITVDVISDVACPWCYVGKRRLEAAVAAWDGLPIEINWHPYQLDPTMTQEGQNRDTYLSAKFGSLDNVKEMTNRLEQVGKEVGIDFDFGDTWLAVNTMHLHQLLHVAGEEGFKDALKERFLEAYFVKSEHLNDTKVLHTILAAFGWSSEKVDTIIADQDLANLIKAQIKNAQDMGVTGVPFFIINNTYGMSGAQPTSAFLESFSSLVPQEVIPEEDSCDSITGTC
ncbi:MAG: putative DsbA family dithiol-disulfide isomerase [Patiriisocius sp.]